MSAQDTPFAPLVSLACHDLRTPLATVAGFAQTLTRLEGVDEKVAGYLGMINTAAGQMTELLDELMLAARIDAGRWDPLLVEVDSLELAREAVETLGEAVDVDGTGTDVAVDREPTARAVRALARCALRHGGLERVALHVDGPALVIEPVAEGTAGICLGRELRDFDSAVGVRVVEALGGVVEREAEAIRVRLPAAPALA